MNMEKKKVTGEVPFQFLNKLGHDTRAMQRFFSLPEEARKNLESSVIISDNPDERIAEAVYSLSEGGEGYSERY